LELFREQDLVVPRMGLSRSGNKSEGFQINFPEHVLPIEGNSKRPKNRKGYEPSAQASAPDARAGAPAPKTAYDVHGSYRRNHQESSLNLALLVAPSLTGRDERLASKFGDQLFQTWFADAHFREGPPLTIVATKRFRCSWIRGRYTDKLQRLFGDDLQFDYEREAVDA
jgi:hypothetical protein